MNSMEFNKIAGATIGALLVFLLLNFFSGMIYGTRGAGHAEDGEHGPVLAYAVAIEAEGGAHGAAEEPQIDLLALFQGADPAAGEKAFRACGACHAVEPGVNKVGPSLHGVVGQDIAAVDGFAYSDAMASEEGNWTPAHLFAFLGDPKGVVPGTKMSYAGMGKHEDRANVIAYLNQTGGAPVDLTEGIEPLAPAGDDHAAAAGGTEVAATGDAAHGAAATAGTDAAHGTAPAEAAPAADAAGSTQGAAGTGGQGAVEHGTAPVVTTPQSSTETTSSSVTGQQEVTVTAVETVDPSKDNVDVTSTTPLEIVEKTPVPEGATGAGPAEQPAGQGAAEQPAAATGQPQTQAMLQATQDAVTQQPAQPSAEAASADQAAPATETPASETPAAESPAAGTGEQIAAAPAQPAAQPAQPAATQAALAGGDAASGEKVFRRCAACHKLEPAANGIGPSLAGVVGRDIAAVEGYNYSDAMAAHEGTWTPELLSQYLEDPKGTIPGNKMAFTGLKKEKDRIDVITYMQQAGQ